MGKGDRTKRPAVKGRAVSRATLPWWMKDELRLHVENALENADWQEHGPGKVAAWSLRGFGELLSATRGDRVNADLASLLGTSSCFETVTAALAPGFVEEHGLFSMRVTSAWVGAALAEAVGVVFSEAPERLAVPTLLRTRLEAIERQRPAQAPATRLANLEAAARELDLQAVVDRIGTVCAGPLDVAPAVGSDAFHPHGTAWSTLERVFALEAVAESDGAALKAQLRTGGGVAYSPKRRFSVGEIVTHPRFGGGVVTRVEEGKVVVRFEHGELLLAHGLGG